MRITVKDIARAAGVSRGTVDRVLHNRSGVSAQAKESVLAALDACSFKPNMVAKALATHRNPKTVHVVVAPTFNPFVDEILEGIRQAEREYADYGLSVRVHELHSFDRDEQLDLLKNIIDEGCDGLALVPVASTAIANAVNNIYESGVPVVVYNSDLPDARYACFVGPDQIKGGQTAGALMNVIVGKGRVCIILGIKDLHCHMSRMKGFKRELSKDISIYSVDNNDDRDDQAYEAAKRFLKKSGGNIDGVYITGGGITGLITALKEEGLDKKVKVISHDITPPAIHYLKNGSLHFTLGQDPRFQGYKSVSVLFDILYRNLKPPTRHIYTNIDIRIKTNI